MVANIFHDFPENVFKFYFMSLKDSRLERSQNYTWLVTSMWFHFLRVWPVLLRGSSQGNKSTAIKDNMTVEGFHWETSARCELLRGLLLKETSQALCDNSNTFHTHMFCLYLGPARVSGQLNTLGSKQGQLAFLLYFQSVGAERVTPVEKYHQPFAHVSMIANQI